MARTFLDCTSAAPFFPRLNSFHGVQLRLFATDGSTALHHPCDNTAFLYGKHVVMVVVVLEEVILVVMVVVEEVMCAGHCKRAALHNGVMQQLVFFL